MCRAILVVHCPLVVRSLFAQRTARSLALRQLHLSRYAASRHPTPTHNPIVARALVSASMRSANTAMRPPVQSALLWGQRSWLNGDTICHIGHVHLEMSAASGEKKTKGLRSSGDRTGNRCLWHEHLQATPFVHVALVATREHDA